MPEKLLWRIVQPEETNRSTRYRAQSWYGFNQWSRETSRREISIFFQIFPHEPSNQALTFPRDKLGLVIFAKITITGILTGVHLLVSPRPKHRSYNTDEQMAQSACLSRPFLMDHYDDGVDAGYREKFSYHEVLLDDLISTASIRSSHFRCLLVSYHENLRYAISNRSKFLSWLGLGA